MAGPFSPRETTALYLGVNDYGDNFDAIKEDDRYKDDLAGRSVRSLRRKVRYDHQKAMRRQQLFLELLNEHINVYGVDHVQNLVRGALEVAHIQPPNLHDVMNRIDKELLKLETKIPTLLKDFISDFKDAMQRKDPEITINERIHILCTFRALLIFQFLLCYSHHPVTTG